MPKTEEITSRPTVRILFVCVENAGRSQMAEGFAKALAPNGVEIFSAGSKPAAALNPIVVQAMQERGIDIRLQVPKGFAALPPIQFDVVVGMGCEDACPATLAKRVIEWKIPDPKEQPIETVRIIRDQLENQVERLLLDLLG